MLGKMDATATTRAPSIDRSGLSAAIATAFVLRLLWAFWIPVDPSSDSANLPGSLPTKAVDAIAGVLLASISTMEFPYVLPAVLGALAYKRSCMAL